MPAVVCNMSFLSLSLTATGTTSHQTTSTIKLH